MVEYDVKVIHQYAGDLYKQAKSAPAAHFFIGLLFGLVVFAAISAYLLGDLDMVIIAIGILIGAFCGIGSGRAKAAMLRMQAQQALCQAKIEENSRR